MIDHLQTVIDRYETPNEAARPAATRSKTSQGRTAAPRKKKQGASK
jgi:hypothetical protein